MLLAGLLASTTTCLFCGDSKGKVTRFTGDTTSAAVRDAFHTRNAAARNLEGEEVKPKGWCMGAAMRLRAATDAQLGNLGPGGDGVGFSYHSACRKAFTRKGDIQDMGRRSDAAVAAAAQLPPATPTGVSARATRSGATPHDRTLCFLCQDPGLGPVSNLTMNDGTKAGVNIMAHIHLDQEVCTRLGIGIGDTDPAKLMAAGPSATDAASSKSTGLACHHPCLLRWHRRIDKHLLGAEERMKRRGLRCNESAMFQLAREVEAAVVDDGRAVTAESALARHLDLSRSLGPGALFDSGTFSRELGFSIDKDRIMVFDHPTHGALMLPAQGDPSRWLADRGVSTPPPRGPRLAPTLQDPEPGRDRRVARCWSLHVL